MRWVKQEKQDKERWKRHKIKKKYNRKKHFYLDKLSLIVTEDLNEFVQHITKLTYLSQYFVINERMNMHYYYHILWNIFILIFDKRTEIIRKQRKFIKQFHLLTQSCILMKTKGMYNLWWDDSALRTIE